MGGHLGYVTVPVSLPPLSLGLASYSWLQRVTHSVLRPGQSHSTVFLRGPTGNSGNQQTYNNVAMPSELNSDQLLTSFLSNLQIKIYFLICSFPCSINKTEPLQRILFLGLHNTQHTTRLLFTQQRYHLSSESLE